MFDSKGTIPNKIVETFDQIRALLNAAIYNDDLRIELIKRDDFWSLLSELLPIISFDKGDDDL